MSDESGYRAHLATGDTTRARCWRIRRLDGAELGFTDHDRPLTFGGLTFAPDAAAGASEATAALGLGAGDQDLAAALTSDAITEADLARGLYDGAEVTVWDANWRDPAQRVRVAVYTLGEVERAGGALRAELRPRSVTLETRAGRILTPYCDAELGDSRCGVDVSGPPLMRAATVAEVSEGPVLSAPALADAERGFFDGGVLRWTSGANAGLRSEVRAHYVSGARCELHLWRDPPRAIAAGDAFEVLAGCPRTWDACVLKFANGANFRGFPHMPGQRFPAKFGRPAAPGRPKQDGGTRNPKPRAAAAPLPSTSPLDR